MPLSPLTGLGQDVRYGLRLLRHQPRHALLTMFTTALVIGATTMLFGVAYGVLMKPLPWPHADRLVELKETPPVSPVADESDRRVRHQAAPTGCR